MESLLYQSQAQSALQPFDLLVGLLLSLLLGFALSGVYRVTHKGATFEASFLGTITLIAPVICLIIMFIGSNLTLSLGMVGALSIVRFRTAIKDSRDMLYLFLSIAIGLGCGTFNWKPTLIAAIFFYVVMLILKFSKLETPLSRTHVLTVRGDNSFSVGSVQALLDASCQHYSLRSLIKGEHNEAVWEISSYKSETRPESLADALRPLAGVEHVELLVPQIRLPI